MFVRRSLTAAAALLTVIAFAAPAAAKVPLAEDDGTGSGRTVSTVAAALALIGLAAGGWAMRTSGRGAALTSLVLSLAGLVVGVIGVVGADGGVGTGNGLAGAIVAVVLAVIGLVLGGLAFTRSGRST